MASRSCSKSWLGRLWRPRAYIFQRDEGGADNWGEVKKLTASDAEDLARFGWSVAVDGDTALVGADLDDSEFFTNAGAVYLFERDEGGMGNWGEVKKLVASDAQLNGDFGRGVGVSGDTAVVVANGAAYFLVRDEGGAGNWGEVEKVTGPIGGNVAISGDTAVAGSPSDDSEGSNAGAAFVFERDEGGPNDWGQVKKLVASDALPQWEFGSSVAISGDTVVVGAHQEDAVLNPAGAAYVFGRNEGGADNWGEVNKLRASDGQGNDEGGFSVAVSANIAVMGARGEDTAGSAAGAAYVFDLLLPKPLPTLCQFECVGGVAELPDAAGTPLEAEGSSGPGTVVVAGIALAAAGAVALGGVAWYVRRRRA